MTERILRLASRGDGVTADGRHVPFAAPGDLVGADGRLEPGPHRQVPPCRHFPECGGCQLQHVDDAAYAEFVRDRIASALAAQGVTAPELRAVHLSPPNSRVRAVLRFERRGKTVLLGFNAEKSHRIVDMRECHVLRPELFALVEPLRSLLRIAAPPRGGGTVRMVLADQGVDVLIQGASIESLAAAEAITAFAAAQRLARLAIDDGAGPQTLWEPEPVTLTFGSPHPVPVGLPHDVFTQATRDGEAALVAAAREAVGDATVVADLFAGLGTFALSFTGRVYAAEGARDPALALKTAADRVQRPVFVEHRDLFRRPLTSAELDRFAAVVLDPPRAGAKEQVAELAASRVPRIAYVSCNPATFARDARQLQEGGYALDWVQPVGQFRWSLHVELAAAFSRR